MKNVINDKSFEFALKIIDLYKKLNIENEYVISKQLLRSGTSIGANIQEAGAAFSKSDFTYRMSLASKEARESKYWLMLLDKSTISKIDVSELLIDIDHIINILTKIVKTSMEK